MTRAPTPAPELSKLLAHPATIAASCGGAALFGVLTYRSTLAAISSDCLRVPVLAVLPAMISMLVFAGLMTVAASGIWHRLRPHPTWTEVIWAEALGPTLTHAAMFGLVAAVYAAIELPSGCGSPSLVDLALMGLCQLAHIAFLMRKAARLSAFMRRDA